jgi:hypothetical protein
MWIKFRGAVSSDVAINKFENAICYIDFHIMLIDYLRSRKLEAKNKGLAGLFILQAP